MDGPEDFLLPSADLVVSDAGFESELAVLSEFAVLSELAALSDLELAPASEPAPDSAADPESEPAPWFASLAGPPSAAPDDACDVARALELRSFLAQPDPLKWIVGAENALRTGPRWQTGQVAGPSAKTPWITSKRWLQWAQT